VKKSLCLLPEKDGSCSEKKEKPPTEKSFVASFYEGKSFSFFFSPLHHYGVNCLILLFICYYLCPDN